MVEKEDDHFLIDHAPPNEVRLALQSLRSNSRLTTRDLRIQIMERFGYEPQADFAYTTRRLYDLGLSSVNRKGTESAIHSLSSLGQQMVDLLAVDDELYADAMHFLHYDRYNGSEEARKLFWSYRECCTFAWSRKENPPNREVVAHVQAGIEKLMPSAHQSRIGGNFNSGGVTEWRSWLRELVPPPVQTGSRHMLLRSITRYEPVLLAIDYVYRQRGYGYGDSVVLDDELLDDTARIFFLDPSCCRQLIDIASELTLFLDLSDTFAGSAVTLHKPYEIRDI